MLRERVPSAILVVIAAIVPAVLGPPVLTLGLIALATLGLFEFGRAVRTRGVEILLWPAVIISAVLLILTSGETPSPTVILGVFILGSIGLFIATITRGRIEGATADFAHSVAGVVYISLPLAHLSLIRSHGTDEEMAGWFESINNLSLLSQPSEGLAWLVLIVAATWMTDSAAYLGGRAFGRHKMAPVLSPKKTIEGGATGVIFGALTGAGVVALLGLPVPVYVGGAIGLLVSAVGQTGDLAESLIKRDLGIKDMGNLIPGHGGILDRIDALLFTLPVGYYLILLVSEVSWP
jgi:phosphatidate cytidylyltransferase